MNRKHEWESATKKASNRSWEKLFVVLGTGILSAYKDHKTYLKGPQLTFRGEESLNLEGATVAVASDYKKKRNVFRLRLSGGGEYLFEGNNSDEMNRWIEQLQSAIDELDRSPGPSRSQTLPARAAQSSSKKGAAAKKTKTMLPG